MSDDPIDKDATDEQRVQSRAHELEQENSAPVDDSQAQARAMLEYSDSLQNPTTKDLEDGRVERRTSEDATPPPDA